MIEHLETLRYQDGCQNCGHVFLYEEYDESPRFYCTLGAAPRPPCGSVCMGENWLERGVEYKAKMRLWDAWSEPRRIEHALFAPICEKWEKRNDNE